MKTASLIQNVAYNSNKPNVNVLLESNHSKEVRIVLSKGVLMKKHQTPYPIVVEVFEGEIDFGVGSEMYNLKRGDILNLEGNVPHDLNAKENSIVRLTLSLSDSVQRVKKVAD